MTAFPYSKKMADYFQANGKACQKDIHFVLGKASIFNKMNQTVLDSLPPHLAKNCQVAQVKQQKLILLAANGSIATQIRYEAAQLLKKWQQEPLLKEIKEIECKVTPSFNQLTTQSLPQSTETPFEKMPLISQSAAKIIHEMASSLTDPTLKKIMERIATRTKEK